MKLLGKLVVASLMGLPPVFAWATPAPQAGSIKDQVKSLVEQLESSTEAKRVAAEWELLKLGPDILPQLEKAPTKAKETLEGIRKTLEELRPRTASIKGAAMPLA